MLFIVFYLKKKIFKFNNINKAEFSVKKIMFGLNEDY